MPIITVPAAYMSDTSKAERVMRFSVPPMALPSMSGVRDLATTTWRTAPEGMASMLSCRFRRSAVASVAPSRAPRV